MKLGDNTPFTALQYIISSVTMIRAEHSFFITNISKNLVLDVLAKPWQSYSHKKVTFWGKSTASFAVYLTTLGRSILFSHFAKKLASHNSMQKKDNKVDNKTAYKEERQNESERERKIEIDSKQNGLCACTKNPIGLVEKYSWLSITRTFANSNLALTRTKIDFLCFYFIYLL